MGNGPEEHSSYWMISGPGTDFPTYKPDGRRVDVAVVGGGITGLTVALLLNRAGASVAVLEAGRVAAGVTGHTTAKVTSLHGLTYAGLERSFGADGAHTYAEANEAALAEMARLITDLAIDCDFERHAAFTYTEDAGSVSRIEAEVAAATRAGLPATFTTEMDLPYPVAGAIRVEDQAQFHPRRYCAGLADAIVAGGGAIYEQTRVLDVDDGEPCRVRTESGDLSAGHVVQATQLPIVDPGGFFAKTHPERSYALAVELDGPSPQGMYLSVDQPTRSVRPIDDRLVLIGGEGHKVGQDPDTRRRYAALEAFARERFGVVAIRHSWSAQDFMPADGVPYIGRLTPRSEHRLVATGFKKWGITHATVAAMILRDHITGAQNPWASLYDATRLNPKAAAGDLVSENVNVAKRFVGDRLATMRPPPAETLVPGEAGLRTLNGHKVAAYRDDAGTLHAVSARCTHLGCLVTWNTAERSWDCPCHGSRFDVDGGVLQGPAVRPLDPAEPRDAPSVPGGLEPNGS
jgi:glycine/D-amino acid oxidase-like deaminating enzyme/nitrite reductase/ring-hydroxylating ferredoxin subunit